MGACNESARFAAERGEAFREAQENVWSTGNAGRYPDIVTVVVQSPWVAVTLGPKRQVHRILTDPCMNTRPNSTSDAAHFRSIYDLHAGGVTAYALRRCGANDAADVVAETFLVAWRRLDDVPPEPETRPWLLGVTRRVAANQLRGDRRRSELGRKLSSRLVDRFSEQPPIERLDERSVLGAALARLSADDRELLMLVAWDGMTPTEVGVVMDLSSGVVRKRLFRARKRLARHQERVERERLEQRGHYSRQEIPSCRPGEVAG